VEKKQAGIEKNEKDKNGLVGDEELKAHKLVAERKEVHWLAIYLS
jgi:hypothetical protein